MGPWQVGWQDRPLYVWAEGIQSPQHTSPGQSSGPLQASSMALPGQLPGAAQALWLGLALRKQQTSPGAQGTVLQLTLPPPAPPPELAVVVELEVDALLAVVLDVLGAPP